MKSNLSLPVLLLLGSFCYLEAAHILYLVSSAKHNNPGWSLPLLDALVAKGHQVVAISTFEHNNIPEEGLVYYHLPNEYDLMQKHFLDKKTGEYQPMVTLKQLLVWYEVVLGSCRSLMESGTLNSMLPELVAQVMQEFDLVITDITEGVNCLQDLVTNKNSVPILGLSGGKLTPDLISMLHAENTISASRIPHHLSQVPKNMGFWNRLHNHIMYLGEPIINWLIIHPVLAKTVPTGNVFSKLPLVLLNTHPVVDYIQNLPPNVIEVGGLHIKDKVNALPTYIEKFTEKFIYGIVYINMPYIESIRLGVEAMVEMIKNNPNCGFIWNAQDMQVLPTEMPNLLTLHVDQSLQQDILAAPAVKGFLNHGDSFSVQEAVYYGLPMIVLPLTLEQFNTAQRVKERSLGVIISANEFHLKYLTEALHLILDVEHFTTALYHAKVKFRSRLQSPMQIAIWHIEQLIADSLYFKDLKVPRQNFFVAHSLDVLAVPFLLIVIFLLNLSHVIYNIVKGPQKKQLKKRKKVEKNTKEVEKKEPVNKSSLEDSKDLIEHLKDEIIEGEMELLAANPSNITNEAYGLPEDNLKGSITNEKLKDDLLSLPEEKTLQDKKED